MVEEGGGKVPIGSLARNGVLEEQLPQVREAGPHLSSQAVVFLDPLDSVQHLFVQHAHVSPEVFNVGLEDRHVRLEDGDVRLEDRHVRLKDFDVTHKAARGAFKPTEASSNFFKLLIRHAPSLQTDDDTIVVPDVKRGGTSFWG